MNFLESIYRNLTAPIDTEAGALNNIPNFIIAWTVFMSANAIFQAIADIIIEILILLSIIPVKIEFRLEFLFLTMISSVIAYLTLVGTKKGNLDLTQNTLLIGLLVESSLVIADFYLLYNTNIDFWPIFFIRFPFMILTLMNILIISNIILRRIKLRKSRPNYRF